MFTEHTQGTGRSQAAEDPIFNLCSVNVRTEPTHVQIWVGGEQTTEVPLPIAHIQCACFDCLAEVKSKYANQWELNWPPSELVLLQF